MVEKIKVSVECDRALKNVVASRVGGADEVLMEHGKFCTPRFGLKGADPYWEGDNSPLNNLTLAEMAQALYIGYYVDESNEDKLREFYKMLPLRPMHPDSIVKETLFIMGLYVEGVSDH